jgi:hypothetical protein
MSEVVSKGYSLGKVFIKAKGAGKRSGYLGHLKGMGQAGTVVISLMVDKYLCLVFKAPEGTAMDYAIPVTLVACAHRVLGLIMASALR